MPVQGHVILQDPVGFSKALGGRYVTAVARVHLCRPRVGLQEAHNLSDVQRFYIIMAPNLAQGRAHCAWQPLARSSCPRPRARFWCLHPGPGSKEVRGRASMHPKQDVDETQHWCSTLGQTDAWCPAVTEKGSLMMESEPLGLCCSGLSVMHKTDMLYTNVQMEELTAGLGPKENSTKTMGVRRTEAARAAGEGTSTPQSPL